MLRNICYGIALGTVKHFGHIMLICTSHSSNLLHKCSNTASDPAADEEEEEEDDDDDE